jgi:hypothetical protein
MKARGFRPGILVDERISEELEFGHRSRPIAL